uniref:Uncharacterized protein n=1 Tax=Photinus pyralis TaxID=7054 RepID=A0A1Y1JU53_PHOPY
MAACVAKVACALRASFSLSCSLLSCDFGLRNGIVMVASAHSTGFETGLRGGFVTGEGLLKNEGVDGNSSSLVASSNLNLTPLSTLSLHEGLRSYTEADSSLSRVGTVGAAVVIVAVTLTPLEESACSLLLVLLLLLLTPVWFFFLTSCSADLISSSVTPCVDRRVSRTRLACAFRCVSLSSSLTGGTNDTGSFWKLFVLVNNTSFSLLAAFSPVLLRSLKLEVLIGSTLVCRVTGLLHVGRLSSELLSANGFGGIVGAAVFTDIFTASSSLFVITSLFVNEFTLFFLSISKISFSFSSISTSILLSFVGVSGSAEISDRFLACLLFNTSSLF